jgi:hypothetical protein
MEIESAISHPPVSKPFLKGREKHCVRIDDPIRKWSKEGQRVGMKKKRHEFKVKDWVGE